AEAWKAGELTAPARGDSGAPPDRPARPDRPVLVAPGKVPRRRLTRPEGRIALLHAVAHIELNAIDLAFDLVARFAGDSAIADAERADFVHDWLGVGAEEAHHFGIVADRLHAYGANYGDLPAHDGLWLAALESAGDIAARLAVAPLVLEARGLDVTPAMIDRLRAAGDEDSAEALGVIYCDEIGHVAAGAKWFAAVCRQRGEEPTAVFRRLTNDHVKGAVRPPFNIAARNKAGVPEEYYLPLADDDPGER
ncbi:MAG: ferritin-like domain-containing protein, partial [Caulobacterales bacterium]|nr:ferritin-like domain-containing protein [Caulobacterales bacterium]